MSKYFLGDNMNHINTNLNEKKRELSKNEEMLLLVSNFVLLLLWKIIYNYDSRCIYFIKII